MHPSQTIIRQAQQSSYQPPNTPSPSHSHPDRGGRYSSAPIARGTCPRCAMPFYPWEIWAMRMYGGQSMHMSLRSWRGEAFAIPTAIFGLRWRIDGLEYRWGKYATWWGHFKAFLFTLDTFRSHDEYLVSRNKMHVTYLCRYWWFNEDGGVLHAKQMKQKITNSQA